MKIQARKALLPTLAVCGAAALIGIASSGSAVAAGTATTTMGVSLTITAGCLTTATPLAFGSTSVLAASIYQQSTVNVTCTNLTPYDIGLDPGANFATTRNMKSAGAALVSYKLWRESAHSSAWGTAVGTDTVSGIGSGVLIATTVYGEVTAQTSPIPAIYADIVNVTVTF